MITGKLALKYAGRNIESMKAIAAASQKRSLAEFQKVFVSLLTKNLNYLLTFNFRVA